MPLSQKKNTLFVFSNQRRVFKKHIQKNFKWNTKKKHRIFGFFIQVAQKKNQEKIIFVFDSIFISHFLKKMNYCTIDACANNALGQRQPNLDGY